MLSLACGNTGGECRAHTSGAFQYSVQNQAKNRKQTRSRSARTAYHKPDFCQLGAELRVLTNKLCGFSGHFTPGQGCRCAPDSQSPVPPLPPFENREGWRTHFVLSAEMVCHPPPPSPPHRDIAGQVGLSAARKNPPAKPTPGLTGPPTRVLFRSWAGHPSMPFPHLKECGCAALRGFRRVAIVALDGSRWRGSERCGDSGLAPFAKPKGAAPTFLQTQKGRHPPIELPHSSQNQA